MSRSGYPLAEPRIEIRALRRPMIVSVSAQEGLNAGVPRGFSTSAAIKSVASTSAPGCWVVREEGVERRKRPLGASFSRSGLRYARLSAGQARLSTLKCGLAALGKDEMPLPANQTALACAAEREWRRTPHV